MNDIEDNGFVTVYDSARSPRGRVMGHSRVEGAEKVEGHSAGRTGGASDLPELRSQEELDRMDRLPLWQGWLVVAVGFLALCAIGWPDLVAWWHGEPPVMIGGQP